jgi:large subunit ribosomal protein L10
MTKQEKFEFVKELTDTLKDHPNFYLVDIDGFSVEKNNAFRRKCFENQLKIKSVKNTLLKKSLAAQSEDYSGIYEALHYSTTLIFVNEDAKQPAKVIKAFRQEGEKPLLKGAYIEGSAYVGDNNLDALINIKSKNDLIADVVALLESPIKNVVSGLQSSGNTIAGLLKTLEERNT